MGLVDVNQTIDSPHKGSGLMGALVGAGIGLAAGIATVASAGAAAPATVPAAGAGVAAATAGTAATAGSVAGAAGTIAGATGAGETLGGLAGGVIDPAKAAESSSHSPMNSASQAKLPIQSMQDHPELQIANLVDAKSAIKEDGSLTGPQADQYLGMLNAAHSKLQQRLGIGG